MLPFIAGFVYAQRGYARAAAMGSAANNIFGGVAANKMEDNEARFDRMLLVIEAMWTLLKEQGLTDEQLMAKMEELDKADNVVDGRKTPTVTVCRSCGSKVQVGRPICQICGEKMPEVAVNPFGKIEN